MTDSKPDQNNQMDPFNQLMFGPPMGPPPEGQPQNQQQNQSNQLPTQSLKGQDGNLDLNKIMDGADKLFKMIDKTGPMIKQISPFLDMLKKK